MDRRPVFVEIVTAAKRRFVVGGRTIGVMRYDVEEREKERLAPRGPLQGSIRHKSLIQAPTVRSVRRDLVGREAVRVERLIEPEIGVENVQILEVEPAGGSRPSGLPASRNADTSVCPGTDTGVPSRLIPR